MAGGTFPRIPALATTNMLIRPGAKHTLLQQCSLCRQRAGSVCLMRAMKRSLPLASMRPAARGWRSS